MWTSPKPLNAKICSRPARLAYLIPENPSNELIDTLIAESLSRWGGRRTPLIPTNGEIIAPAYWALLDLWDADIIYSYVKLSEAMENRLYYKFAPSEIRTHEGLTEHNDAHDLWPDYTSNFRFVPSLSLLPFFARRAQAEGAELPQIVDKEHWVETDRDLDDSFGFVSNSHFDHSLLPYACRLSLRPNQSNTQITQRFSGTSEISYVEDADSLIETIAKRRGVLTLSRLADMLCPHLYHLARGQEGWDDHLTIVVGDTIADRLLFWNAQHRYPAIGGLDDLPVLRLGPKRVEDGAPDWCREWIAVRNHRHLNGNQAPQTVLRSCSLSKERLDEIAGALSGKGMVTVSFEHHADPCLFHSCEDWTLENRKGTMERIFPSIWTHPEVNRQARVRLQDKEFELPLTPPWHIGNVAPSSLTAGVWAIDLTLDRAEDHSRLPYRRHIWKFPRRLRLESAVGFENYAAGGIFPVWLPPPRPTEDGDLTVWDCADWTRPTLTLPSDYDAFSRAIARLAPGSPQARRADESGSSDARFDRIGVSDKGRDLLGVFQLFGSLPEALAFLTDTFWLKVIDRLSPEEPANKPRNVSDLAEKLKGLVDGDRQDVSDYEHIARRALFLAARSFASQGEQLKSANFDKLLKWATEGQGQDRGNEIKEQLIKSVTYLRNRGFLWQGFQWTCSFCQHRNWVPLERLSTVSVCEICRKSKSSPVAGSLDFCLNPFVHHAFASTSAQRPVIWCLDQLANRASWSFAFAPALNLYRLGKNEPETDLDLVAAVDGRIYLVEVKSSFAGVEPNVLDQLKRLADELRPDVVMLAIQAKNSDVGERAEMLEAFSSELGAYNVHFELLTLDHIGQSESDDEIASPLSKQMNWSAW